jgi:hypothetical protein
MFRCTLSIIYNLDSYEHRAGVRAKLGGDDNWISQYFGKILPWFQKQENMTLNALPNFDSVVHPKDKGMYKYLPFMQVYEINKMINSTLNLYNL